MRAVLRNGLRPLVERGYLLSMNSAVWGINVARLLGFVVACGVVGAGAYVAGGRSGWEAGHDAGILFICDRVPEHAFSDYEIGRGIMASDPDSGRKAAFANIAANCAFHRKRIRSARLRDSE